MLQTCRDKLKVLVEKLVLEWDIKYKRVVNTIQLMPVGSERELVKDLLAKVVLRPHGSYSVVRADFPSIDDVVWQSEDGCRDQDAYEFYQLVCEIVSADSLWVIPHTDKRLSVKCVPTVMVFLD